jgi:membrane associated rhomboid family serine protease
LRGKLRETPKMIAALMPSIFIFVWLVCGVITVIFGFILSGEKEFVPPFTAAAKAWFGVAIAAVYAYFGIRPNGSTGGEG